LTNASNLERCTFPKENWAHLSFDYTFSEVEPKYEIGDWVGLAEDTVHERGDGTLWDIYLDDSHVMYKEKATGVDCKSTFAIIPRQED